MFERGLVDSLEFEDDVLFGVERVEVNESEDVVVADAVLEVDLVVGEVISDSLHLREERAELAKRVDEGVVADNILLVLGLNGCVDHSQVSDLREQGVPRLHIVVIISVHTVEYVGTRGEQDRELMIADDLEVKELGDLGELRCIEINSRVSNESGI